jgi:hypothetical protein
MIELEFVPHRAALIGGQENTLDVLLRVKAPAAPESRRERLPLILRHSSTDPVRCGASRLPKQSAAPR